MDTLGTVACVLAVLGVSAAYYYRSRALWWRSEWRVLFDSLERAAADLETAHAALRRYGHDVSVPPAAHAGLGAYGSSAHGEVDRPGVERRECQTTAGRSSDGTTTKIGPLARAAVLGQFVKWAESMGFDLTVNQHGDGPTFADTQADLCWQAFKGAVLAFSHLLESSRLRMEGHAQKIEVRGDDGASGGR